MKPITSWGWCCAWDFFAVCEAEREERRVGECAPCEWECEWEPCDEEEEEARGPCWMDARVGA